MSFQTRSDNSKGKYPGCCNFETLGGAYKAAQSDHSIWKISYKGIDGETSHRWVRILEDNKVRWEDKPLRIVKRMQQSGEWRIEIDESPLRSMSDADFEKYAHSHSCI